MENKRVKVNLFQYPIRVKTKSVDKHVLKSGERIPTRPKNVWSKLYYIRYGKGHFSTPHKKLIIKPNHLYIFPPDEEVHFHLEEETEIYWAQIRAQIFFRIDFFQFIGGYTEHLIEEVDEYESDFLRWHREFNKSKINNIKLLSLALSAISPVEKIEPDDEKIESQKSIQEFLPVLEYIHQNYNKKLTVLSLSKFLYLSETHFAAKFTKVIGLAPLRYVNLIRMEEAQHLLVETNDTLQMISSKVGYSDASHFSKTFKDYTSYSPGKFRKVNPLN